MTRRDPDLHFVRRALEDDAAWLAKHAADIHELAYGTPGGSPDVIVQSHTNTDVGNRLGIVAPEHDRNLGPKNGTADKTIGTPEQQAWADLLAACRRLEAVKTAVQKAFNRGRQEYRPPLRLTKKDAFDRQQTIAAARRRRADPDQYTPAPLNPETGLHT